MEGWRFGEGSGAFLYFPHSVLILIEHICEWSIRACASGMVCTVKVGVHLYNPEVSPLFLNGQMEVFYPEDTAARDILNFPVQGFL